MTDNELDEAARKQRLRFALRLGMHFAYRTAPPLCSSAESTGSGPQSGSPTENGWPSPAQPSPAQRSVSWDWESLRETAKNLAALTGESESRCTTALKNCTGNQELARRKLAGQPVLAA